jgi:hypothetical protein
MTGWLRRYAAHDDPLVAAGNFVALVLAWNQPFYPLYLWLIAGSDAWVQTPDVLSGLFFFAIPAVARRNPLLGRTLLPVFGVANVVVCSWLLGEEAGLWLLLFPCGMLAALLFTWRERWWMVVLTALPLVVWLAMRGRLGPPPAMLTPEQLASINTMNAVSAFALVVFFGWVFARRPA